jgi:hypothetical protein
MKTTNNAWNKYCKKQVNGNLVNWTNILSGNQCAHIDYAFEDYTASINSMRAYARRDGFYTKSDGIDGFYISRNKALFC